MKLESVPQVVELVDEIKRLRQQREVNRAKEQSLQEQANKLSIESFEIGRKLVELQDEVMDLVFETKDGSFL